MKVASWNVPIKLPPGSLQVAKVVTDGTLRGVRLIVPGTPEALGALATELEQKATLCRQAAEGMVKTHG